VWLASGLGGCDAPEGRPADDPVLQPRADTTLVDEVRRLADDRGIGPLAAAPDVRPALVTLGRALAFDKELSGNRNISCMTCHLPKFATGDNRSLSIGEGATGFNGQRVHPTGVFIPRNAPPLFNLHAMDALFWDGRVFVDEDGFVRTPAGDAVMPEMQAVFEFGAASAIGLFPVLSRIEMRGNPGTNELAAFADDDFEGAWAALMARLGAIPADRSMCEAAYPGTPFAEMTFAHASNAIGGFFVAELEAVDTKWDRFLAGDDAALNDTQLRGARNFLTARCHVCHGGDALTDLEPHNVALRQFGPGVGNGADGKDDFGAMNVTGDSGDRYAFRTTPLRNVELTGPYGHAGQFDSLKDFIGHYSESHLKLASYDVTKIHEPLLTPTLRDNVAEILATRDPLLEGVVFPDTFRDELHEFMKTLTDPASRNLRFIAPVSVPSGLPIDKP